MIFEQAEDFRRADTCDVLYECYVATLNLRPVVPRVYPKPCRVLAEGLMEDSDDDHLSGGAGCSFRQLLKKIDVVARAESSRFEKLPHLVDDEQRPVKSVLLGS